MTGWTMKAAKDLLYRSYGCTLRKQDGEYRVNFVGFPEATAYYTNDIEDAVGTAYWMWRRRAEGKAS